MLWHHDFADDPVEIFSEIGDDDYEARKVELFRDGRLKWADAEHEVGTTGLGELPFPPATEIDALDEFSATKVDVSLFEAIWRRATSISDQ